MKLNRLGLIADYHATEDSCELIVSFIFLLIVYITIYYYMNLQILIGVFTIFLAKINRQLKLFYGIYLSCGIITLSLLFVFKKLVFLKEYNVIEQITIILIEIV